MWALLIPPRRKDVPTPETEILLDMDAGGLHEESTDCTAGEMTLYDATEMG
jgi:hypothetical protein